MKLADLKEKAAEKLPAMDFLKQKRTGDRKGGGGKKRVIAVILVVAIVCGIVAYKVVWTKSAAAESADYTTAEVTYQDISQTLTGSGTLEAANSYDVTSLVEGEVLSANFEEGDEVEEGSVLYELDSSDLSNNLEKAEISLSESQRSYNDALKSQDDLTLTADKAGTVYDLNVEVGDEVTAGEQVATIRDSSVMELTVSFPSDDAANFYVGEAATVTLDGSFETLSAKVSKISGVDTVLTGNRIVRAVTLQVTNPGAISDTQLGTATVNGVGSSDSSTFTYRAEVNITASVSGTVSKILVSEGDTVKKDATLMVLSSDTVEEKVQSAADSLKNAELSYESTQNELDSYTITSPISGTVIDKNYEVGETTESSTVLCTIYDMSYLTMTLNVDELDISEMAVGQTVSITADAVEGQTYTGTVTKVSVAGTTSSGATTYPVTIRIDDCDGLLPGMNVDASIEVAESSNTLVIPAAALTRGDMVLITDDSPSASNALDTEAPDGYVYVSITTGVSNDDSIEVTSGLQEGDTVAYVQETTSSSDSTQQQVSILGGGMTSGGGDMPSGGGPSGAPSGGGPGGGG